MRNAAISPWCVAICAVGAGSASAQFVADPGFEAGTPNPSWTESSTNFGTPLCNGDCLGPGHTTAARTGQWWAWFGGVDGSQNETLPEIGVLSQTIVIPPGAATLLFYITGYSTRADGQDSFTILIDSTVVFQVTDLDCQPGAGYNLGWIPVPIDLSAYSGAARLLTLRSVTHGGGYLTNFFVDDVGSLTGPPPLICYPNCDASSAMPCLNVQDFGCFLNKFAAGDMYANCDGSTTAPALNIQDFACFLNQFAAGCSLC